MAEHVECTLCGSALTPTRETVLSALPEFDLRYSLCLSGYRAMVEATFNRLMVKTFLLSHPVPDGQLARPRMWREMEPAMQLEFERWIIALLQIHPPCTRAVAA